MPKPIVHIGPPKTASTTLQEIVIPHLGRPFQIKPEWTKLLVRVPEIVLPDRQLEPDIIISDEALGEFLAFPPEIVSQKISHVIPGAKILFIERSPLELFYSLYRQRLVNMAYGLAKDPALNPKPADRFFQIQEQEHIQFGAGFFSMISVHRIKKAFEKFFEYQSIQYGLLAKSPRQFVAEFAAACGTSLDVELPKLNQASKTAIEQALEGLKMIPEDRKKLFVDLYENSRLSPERETIIREWPH